jgi:threonine dehydrogenase-like Zn-dependent dehydrogenase
MALISVRAATPVVAIRMIEQGLLPIDEIVTHRLPLKDYQKGIDLVLSGLTSVKVTLEP